MWEASPLFSQNEQAVELRDSSIDYSILEKEDVESQFYIAESSKGRGKWTSTNLLLLCIATTARWSASFLRFLVPSFLHRNTHSTNTSSQLKRTSAQGALDGLRGLACLIVAQFHFFERSYEVHYGWVWNPEEPGGGKLATIWNYPIIKLPLAGPNMVAIFFVISGYVLTYRFLSLVHQGKVENALLGMSSATFRRWFRLFPPMFIATFFIQILLQLDVFEYGRPHLDGGSYPPKAEDIATQARWFWEWAKVAGNAFTWDRHSFPDQFDGNMWTIPVEFRCSLVLFLVAVGSAKVKPHLRLGILVLCMGWAMNAVMWEVVLFLMGMFLAQVDVLLEARTRAHGIISGEAVPAKKWNKRWMWIPVMFVALYLCSIPYHHEGAWGWQTLSALDPFPGSFIFSTWQFIGATMMVVAALHCEQVQVFLNWSVIQYLGHLSYALYLVHGSLVKLFTYSLKWDIFDAFKDRYPENLDQLHMGAVWITFLLFLPSVIVVSDVFMRAIDQPSVTWSRKIWEYCTKQ